MNALHSDGAMETFSGCHLRPLEPRTSDIVLADIAHGLSMECRFGRQCRVFYSVAQHCCMVHDILARNGGSALRRAGLMHDAAEAYIGDLPHPIKAVPELAAYREMERRIMNAVKAKFCLAICQDVWTAVKVVDLSMCRTEAVALMKRGVEWDWGEVVAADVAIEPWSPEMAEVEFRVRAAALGIEG